VLCSNFVKFGRREIGEIVRYLPDKKEQISLASQNVDRAYCFDGRSRQNLSGPAHNNVLKECFRFRPNRSTFGGVIAERMNTGKRAVK